MGVWSAYTPVRELPRTTVVMLAVAAITLLISDLLPEVSDFNQDLWEFSVTSALAIGAITMAMRDRMPRGSGRRWLARLVLLLLTLGIAIIGAEFATRWLLRDITSTANNGGYFTRRWIRTGAVYTNAAGFRGREFTPDKPPGVFRIAAVGDSFTFGNGVAEDDRYTEILQGSLPASVEVLNFGTPGDNTPEHLATTRMVVASFRPDFILLQWFVNDVEDDDTRGRPTFRPLLPIASWHRWLDSNSALYTTANSKWGETQVALGMTVSYPDYMRRRFSDPASPSSVMDARLLNELITYVQQRGIPIGIVLFPDTGGDLGEGYVFNYLHERVLATCENRGITCLDLRKDFAAVKDRRQLWANRLDHHPGRRANEIAAERILETFAAGWSGGASK